MLDELKEFSEIPKEPPQINYKRPSLKKTPSNSLNNNILEVSKEEIIEDPINISVNREPTLGDKILLRVKKEEEKKKKSEIYKELNKNKKMNLHQFLSRVQKFEQKRKYNLELKKYKQLQKETESLQDKPKLTYNTLKICKAMPKDPLYKRTNQILDEHEKEIQNLTIFYTMPREIREKTTGENSNNNKSNKFNKSTRFRTKNNNSVENTRNSNYDTFRNSLETIDNLDNKNNKRKKITKQQSDDFFDKEIKWLKNKKAKNQYFENFYQIQNDTYSNVTFRPYVSQATLQILDIKNRLNTNNDEIYKYHIPNSFSQYNHFILNKGRTIWDKLYDEAGQKKSFYDEQLTMDNNNKNIRKKDKFKNVSSKFFDIYLDKDKIKNKRNKNKSFNLKQNNIDNKRGNKSFDDKNYANVRNSNSPNNINGKVRKKKENKRRSFFAYNDAEEYNYYKMRKQKEKFHWRNSLLKIKPIFTQIIDSTYHLNIMQSGAWNDNYVNKITFNDNTKCKSVIDLINTY